MSLTQGFPNVFGETQQTNSVLHNLDNETKKIYNDVNNIMAADGHAHTGNGSDGALIDADSLNVIPIPASIAQGDIIYRGASAFERLPAGTSGQLLKTQGSSANPVWVDAPTGGGVQGSFKALKIQVISNTQATIAADQIVLYDSLNVPKNAYEVSSTLDKTTSGVNGLDTGTIANSTWYYVWVIAKADGTKGVLMSLSSTAPTMPTEYTFKARIGAIRTHTDGTLLRTTQHGNRAQYVVTTSSNTANLPLVASGAAGSPTTPTYIAISLTGTIPPTAFIASGSLSTSGSSNYAILSPANTYGAIGSLSNTPILSVDVNGSSFSIPFNWIIYSSQELYWASVGGNGRVWILGWEDNL